MDDWFSAISTGWELPAEAVRDLRNNGFVVLSGPVTSEELGPLADAYDKAMLEADPGDKSVGGTTIRVHDFVNRGAAFDRLYVHPPVLEACRQTIGRPFKLSSMLGRTLQPRCAAQKLHVDFPRDRLGWPMVGFIFMMDEFRRDNGATLFAAGSHESQADAANEAPERLTPACGPPGSVIVYNGSVWHGHGTNETGEPRRSIQGAYIRREEKSGIDLPSRMRAETLERISPLAKYLLAV